MYEIYIYMSQLLWDIMINKKFKKDISDKEYYYCPIIIVAFSVLNLYIYVTTIMGHYD